MFYTDENRSLWNPYRQAADTKDPYAVSFLNPVTSIQRREPSWTRIPFIMEPSPRR